MKQVFGRSPRTLGILSLLTLPLLACSSANDAPNVFSGAGAAAGAGAGAGGSSTNEAAGGSSGAHLGAGGSLPQLDVPDGSPVGDSGSGASKPPPTNDANCGVQTSQTKQAETDVLLVLDRSGSMNLSIADDCCCDSPCPIGTSGVGVCTDLSNCTKRWPALTSAVGETLSGVTGINWGLKLFSSPTGNVCSVSAGVEVQIGSPKAAETIQKQIAAASPRDNTPTASAINASTVYLRSVTDQNNKVVLLATDGVPNCKGGISTNDPDVDGTITAIQASLEAGFKVYVIGIGPSVGNLDNFAQAGGTDHYYAASSSADLASALATISKTVASCSFTMNANPPDPNNLAVYLDGELVTKDTAEGWSFSANQQTVTLNGTPCDRLQSGAATKVEVLFGCPGEQPPPRID